MLRPAETVKARLISQFAHKGCTFWHRVSKHGACALSLVASDTQGQSQDINKAEIVMDNRTSISHTGFRRNRNYNNNNNNNGASAYVSTRSDRTPGFWG